MHVDAFPSCFGSRSAAAPALPAPAEGGPRFSTSVYKVPLGQAALTWSRAAFGLSLLVDLRLPSASSSPSSSASSGSALAEWTDAAAFTVRLRPWTLLKKRGSKRFYLKGHQSDDDNPRLIRAVDFAWDLSRARFAPGGGPEPATRFFFAVAVDGEMLLVVGDMESKAYKKIPGGRDINHGFSCAQTLVSRREHVVLPRSGKPYTTRARIGGQEREVTIDLRPARDGEGSRLCVEMDGERVLYVKRLRWKFRGNEQVEADGGAARFQVSWDVHRWLFRGKRDASPPTAASRASEPGHAVLLFRFDREEAGDESHRSLGHGAKLYGVESVAGGIVGSNTAAGKKGTLMKTVSSSSSSSAASGCSSSVTEWSSAEEGELRGSFSLLVNVWKS